MSQQSAILQLKLSGKLTFEICLGTSPVQAEHGNPVASTWQSVGSYWHEVALASALTVGVPQFWQGMDMWGMVSGGDARKA